MKKSMIIAAVAALALCACTKVESYQNTTEENEISFGVYVPKAVTKAGSTAVLNDATALQAAHFGVFAAHSTGTPGAYGASDTMDFMWNQEVTYSGGWQYSPVKYWPNQHGTAAVSTPVDKLSFFAYAPYVEATPADGTITSNNTWGITAFTSNTATGDPKVTYVCDATHPVDLLWGVIDESKNWKDANSTNLALTAGLPYLNLIKPYGTTKVKFLFKHALAKIVVDVKTVEDGAGISNIGVDDGTRIFIESLTLTGSSIYNSGVLNLNNTVANTPKWEVSGSPTTTFVVNIEDKDQLYVASTPSAWDNNWNSTGTGKTGVTTTIATLYTGIAIPNSGTSLDSVTIVYDVITKDANLAGGVSVIKNTITKDVTPAAFDNLQAGNVYTLHLQLGMRTVDIDAEITDWVSTVNTTVDLPANN